MSAIEVNPPYPVFADIDGQPLEAGYVWIGTENLDPQTNPINVYWDEALTILAPQPIRTLAGYPSRNGTPGRLYVNSDYSIRVMNKNGSVVYSAPAATERYSDVVVSGVNAKDVIYDPPFIGAVQTDVEAKLAQTVSVKDFGAVGDGVTDDTAAIQAALDAAIGKQLVFPDGVYLVDTSVSLVGDIELVGLGDVLIDGSNSTDNEIITLGGSLGSSVALGGNAAKGATSITVSGLSLSAGNLIWLRSTDTFDTATGADKGEFAVVQSVSGTTVYLRNALYDSYTAATTTVTLVNAATVQINNIKVNRDANLAGLKIQYGRDVSLRDVYVKGANERCIDVNACYNVFVENGGAEGEWFSGSGTSYGIVYINTQHANQYGGFYRGGRHGISVGGTYVSRDINFFGGTVDTSGDGGVAGFDMHGNVEYAKAVGVTSMNGAILQALNLQVLGGFYNASIDVPGLDIRPEVDAGAYFIVDGVSVNSKYGKGLHFVPRFATQTHNLLSITNSYVQVGDSTVSAGASRSGAIVLAPSAITCTVKNLVMNNVTVHSTAANTSGILYALLNTVYDSYTLFENGQISNCNFVASHADVAAFYLPLDSGTNLSFVNCLFQSIATGTGGPGDTSSATVANFDFVNCIFDCGNASSAYRIRTDGILNIIGGKVRNCTGQGLEHTVTVSTSNYVQVEGVEFVNVSGGTGYVNNNTNVTRYTTLSQLGNRVHYRPTIPSNGTWLVGDRCYNSVPSVGQPKSWVCTVAGTPGTWVSEGNL